MHRNVPICVVSLQSINLIATYMWWDIFIVRHPTGALAWRWPSTTGATSTTSASAIASPRHFTILNFKELDGKTIIQGHSPPNHHR